MLAPAYVCVGTTRRRSYRIEGRQLTGLPRSRDRNCLTHRGQMTPCGIGGARVGRLTRKRDNLPRGRSAFDQRPRQIGLLLFRHQVGSRAAHRVRGLSRTVLHAGLAGSDNLASVQQAGAWASCLPAGQLECEIKRMRGFRWAFVRGGLLRHGEWQSDERRMECVSS